LKDKINRRTTLTFGWPDVYFKERKKKTGGVSSLSNHYELHHRRYPSSASTRRLGQQDG
jgi:hypothetical protein